MWHIFQVIATGMNPVQIARGIEKTAKALVEELKKMSREVKWRLLFFLFISSSKKIATLCLIDFRLY